MDTREAAAVAAVVGGTAWVTCWTLAAAGGPPAAFDAAYWVGVAVLAAACVLTGAALVSRSAPLPRLVVALCVPAMAWALLGVLRTGADPVVVDAAVGALALVAGLTSLARAARSARRASAAAREVARARHAREAARRRAASGHRRTAGSHAR